jgi:hypothetical protein
MKLVSKTLLAATLLTAAMALNPGAHAATIKISFDKDLFPAGSDRPTFVFNDGTNTKSAKVNAGMFGGSATDGAGFDPKTLYRSADDALFYCVDILKNLRKQVTTYRVNDVTASTVDGDGSAGNPRRDFGRVLEFLGAVNDILGGGDYGLGFGDKNWLNPSSGWMSGAIQVGIWESLYEKEYADLAVDSGAFSISSGLSEEGATLLASVFTAMSTSNALNGDQVKWFSTKKGQDLIADPVPVPAPLALLGAGLGLLAFGRRISGHR